VAHNSKGKQHNRKREARGERRGKTHSREGERPGKEIKENVPKPISPSSPTTK